IELFIKSPLENGLTRGEQMELARIALVSLDAEPVAYIFKHPAGELFWALTDKSNKGQNDVIPVYAVPPASVTGIYDDVLNIIGLLENNEWAEHCTGTVLGSLLESEITRLVSKEQSVPVVPDEMATSDDMNLYQKSFAQGYNACRNAMLNGGKS
ncbi:TPA: molecular chaperone DnaJ, partial [Salmonella enterica]|nr:molecular chaperone DnaJ [Salmonella enterica]